MQISQLPNFKQPSLSLEKQVIEGNEEELPNSQKNQLSIENQTQSTSSSIPNTEISNENEESSGLIDQSTSTSAKRKFFTKKEDQLLTIAAIKFNQESWSNIAKCVPGKTPKQCRDRWVNYLQTPLNLGPWNEKEDKLLVSLVNKFGTHWSKMKAAFPNRSTNSLKNRWYWLIKNQIRVATINNIPNMQVQTNSMETIDNINMRNNNAYINQNDDNNNYQNATNNNTTTFSSTDNTQQQKYYYLIKPKPKKRSYNKSPKRKNSETLNNQCIPSVFHDLKNNDETTQLFKDDDVITFNPDELEW